MTAMTGLPEKILEQLLKVHVQGSRRKQMRRTGRYEKTQDALPELKNIILEANSTVIGVNSRLTDKKCY